jgi:hypothetical protein
VTSSFSSSLIAGRSNLSGFSFPNCSTYKRLNDLSRDGAEKTARPVLRICSKLNGGDRRKGNISPQKSDHSRKHWPALHVKFYGSADKCSSDLNSVPNISSVMKRKMNLNGDVEN